MSEQRQELTIRLDSTSYTTSHLLYDGKGGWIEAKRVYVKHPHPEVDAATDGFGWEFKSGIDAVRWLES